MKQINSNSVKKLIETIQINYGLSVGQFAQKVGITPEGVYRILDDRTKKVRISTINQICDSFNYKFVTENNEPKFYPIDDIGPAPPNQNDNYQAMCVIREHAEKLGYDPTPEGLDLFLRECQGQYQTLHNIRRLLFGSQDNEKPKIDKS